MHCVKGSPRGSPCALGPLKAAQAVPVLSECPCEEPWVFRGRAGRVTTPWSPHSAAQREGAAPAAGCPVRELPLLRALVGASVALLPRGWQRAICCSACWMRSPACCQRPMKAGVPWGGAGAGDAGCPSGWPGAWQCIQTDFAAAQLGRAGANCSPRP